MKCEPVRSPNRRPRWRAARRREMKEQGVTPTQRQWVWCVAPERVEIPERMRRSAVRGLGQQADRVWLWWVDAKALIAMDRARGGRSDVTRAELRHCGMCGRPLAGAEAAVRRRMDESGPDGRRQVCSERCVEDMQSRVWLRLNPHFQTLKRRGLEAA